MHNFSFRKCIVESVLLLNLEILFATFFYCKDLDLLIDRVFNIKDKISYICRPDLILLFEYIKLSFYLTTSKFRLLKDLFNEESRRNSLSSLFRCLQKNLIIFHHLISFFVVYVFSFLGIPEFPFLEFCIMFLPIFAFVIQVLIVSWEILLSY